MPGNILDPVFCYLFSGSEVLMVSSVIQVKNHNKKSKHFATIHYPQLMPDDVLVVLYRILDGAEIDREIFFWGVKISLII